MHTILVDLLGEEPAPSKNDIIQEEPPTPQADKSVALSALHTQKEQAEKAAAVLKHQV